MDRSGSVSDGLVAGVQTGRVPAGVPGYAWWEVAISEVSEVDTVKDAYADYVEKKKKQRYSNMFAIIIVVLCRVKTRPITHNF